MLTLDNTVHIYAGQVDSVATQRAPWHDFFDLGGDSIESIQIQHAISRDFEVVIKNTEFLYNPTIAGLAVLFEANSETKRLSEK